MYPFPVFLTVCFHLYWLATFRSVESCPLSSACEDRIGFCASPSPIRQVPMGGERNYTLSGWRCDPAQPAASFFRSIRSASHDSNGSPLQPTPPMFQWSWHTLVVPPLLIVKRFASHALSASEALFATMRYYIVVLSVTFSNMNVFLLFLLYIFCVFCVFLSVLCLLFFMGRVAWFKINDDINWHLKSADVPDYRIRWCFVYLKSL